MSPPYQLLPVIENLISFSSGSHLKMCAEEMENVEIKLSESQLWKEFNEETTEMIVTNRGRRMFPVIKVSASGLESNSTYCILLEFVQVDLHKWKYAFGEWLKSDKQTQPRPSTIDSVYVHSDSPNFGTHWIKTDIAFDLVKISNKKSGGADKHVKLNSLHKYQPRIHILKIDISTMKCFSKSFTFPETQFIAVTAYQNEEIKNLKVKLNPYAKAFLASNKRQNFIWQSCQPSTNFTSAMTQYGEVANNVYSSPSQQIGNNWNPRDDNQYYPTSYDHLTNQSDLYSSQPESSYCDNTTYDKQTSSPINSYNIITEEDPHKSFSFQQFYMDYGEEYKNYNCFY